MTSLGHGDHVILDMSGGTRGLQTDDVIIEFDGQLVTETSPEEIEAENNLVMSHIGGKYAMEKERELDLT
jgi:hypothetical protein